MKFLKLLFLSISFGLISCNDSSNSVVELERIHADLKQQFAPDKRVELFDIKFENKNNTIILSGETTTKKAFDILVDSLKKKNISFKNEVRILPDEVVGDKKYALGNNSVINIRSKPKHSAELGTQGLLGMSLRILDKKGDFYRVQTPDNYISWVDHGGIQQLNKQEFENWQDATKIIYTKNNGLVYASKNNNATIVSDIVFGSLLKFISEENNFYKVAYPDGRIGFVKKPEAVLYNSWLKNNPSNANFIEESAKTM